MTDQILKTNLKELESMIEDTFLHGPEKYSLEDIQKKFDFMQKIMYAEQNSSDPTKPPHWHPIAQKLDSLKNSFNERDKDSMSQFTTFSNPKFDKDTISNSSSNCSCTQSCLNNNDVGESGLVDLDDPKNIFPEFVGEKAIVEFRGNEVDENSEKINVGRGKIGTFYFEDAEDSFEDFGRKKEVVEFDCCSKEKENNELKREQKVKSGFRKNCCVLVSGVGIGMILMGFIMVNFSGCFEYVEQTSFAIPT
ncbi:hypothetical protein QL285_067389 [Trifolium repens]|nr:hypothetical protein QL285_067389 [Trifolium repens]